MDSFKRLLEDDDEFSIPEHKLRDIERNIHRSVKPARFTASTVDLFVPKAVDSILAMFGANSIKKKKNVVPDHRNDPAAGGF
jgi:hypothetical protein